MKKVFGIFAVIALAVVVSVNVSMNSRDEDLSDLALANIEALASGESGQTLDCWQTISVSKGGYQTHKTYCGSCEAKLCNDWYSPSTCN